MRYLVQMDVPIAVTEHCSADNLELEQWAGVPHWWTETAQQTVDGIKRRYYAACPPYRVLVVMRTGLDLRRLNMSPGNCYASVLVGWDEGSQGYVRATDVGRRHTKISIDTLYTFTDAYAQAHIRDQGIELITWSELLRKAPRSDQRGGYRGTQGRQRIDQDEATARISASVPRSYVDALRQLGNGDIAAGVRAAVEVAAPPRSETITITSRKVAEHQIEPTLIEIDGRAMVELGDGLLAEIMAANVAAGVIPGEIQRRGDTLYYWHPDGYATMRLLVMVRP